MERLEARRHDGGSGMEKSGGCKSRGWDAALYMHDNRRVFKEHGSDDHGAKSVFIHGDDLLCRHGHGSMV